MRWGVRFSTLLQLAVLVALVFGILVPLNNPVGVQAQNSQQDDGEQKRKAILIVEVYEYNWWVSRWRDNRIVCTVTVEHPGAPYGSEILKTCGDEIYEDWFDTPQCSKDRQSECQGVYLHLVSEGRATREMEVELPMAEAWVSLQGCTSGGQKNACQELPNLRFTGVEPLPNETIIRIQVLVDGQAYSCPMNECDLPLRPTSEKGLEIEFWAVSSFGDESPHYTAFVRVVPWGDFADPDSGGQDKPLFYVDVLSSQWRGERPSSCAETWGSFPPLGGLPLWLTTPATVQELTSDSSYYYLAAMLIKNNAVDIQGCPDGGLANDLAANTCGLQRSLDQVRQWQNQFDTEILRVANETGVPGHLLKNIFERESQFWPGIYQNWMETGLGQMTENGADVILLWNPSFFDQFCPLVLSQDTCSKGFNQLNDDHKRMLRGALVVKVNADCPECPNGIDLSQANFSVSVFAETLLANCEQAGQLIFNTTQEQPGFVAEYDDLWRFTLVNYNAGAGCLLDAIEDVSRRRAPLNWENVSRELDPACQGAVEYVEEVTQVELPTPATPTSAAPNPTQPPGAEQTPQPDPDDFQG